MAVSLLSRLSDDHPQRQEEDDLWAIDEKKALINEFMIVLTSRPRLPGIASMPLVNSSVLNYGFDDRVHNNEGDLPRHKIIENHLRYSIMHFEPRLSNLQLSVQCQSTDRFNYTLDAQYINAPLSLKLVWDENVGRFSLDG